MARRIDITIGTSFDAKGVRQAAAEVDRLARSLRGLGQGSGAGGGLGGLQATLPAVGRQAQQTERSMLALARAQAALARDNGNVSAAVRILQTALAGVSRESVAAVNTQRQLGRYMRELDQGARSAAGGMQVLPRTIAGLSHAAADFARVAAGAFAVERVVQFGAAAVGAANRLEDAQLALKTISGDTATYAKTLEVAAQNQRLFGGSMAENIEDMSSFVVSSRLAGVELEQLLNISQRLATLDPGQGARGASIALRELLSGNTRSLAARFELPAATIKAMGDESLTATQKLEALSAFLDEVGITSEAITGKLNNNSQAFRDLAAAGDALTTALGSALAEALAPWADKLAMVLNVAAQGVNQLGVFEEKLADSKARALEGADSYEEYAASIDYINEKLRELPGVSGSVAQLTQAQFAFAQSLMESGVAAGEAYALVEDMSRAQQQYAEELIAGGMAAGEAAAQAREYGSAIDAVNVVQGRLFDDAGASSDQLRYLGDAMLEVAMASDEGRARIEELAAQYQAGEISSNQLEDAVMQLAAEQQEAAEAAAREAEEQARLSAEKAYADANSRALADSLMTQAEATDTSTAAGQAEKDALEAAAKAAQEKANAGGTLEDQAWAAAEALIAAGNAGAQAAAQLAGNVGEVDQMTAALYRLQAAQLAAGAGGAAKGLLGIGRGGDTTKGKGVPAGQGSSARTIAAMLRNQGEGPSEPEGPAGGRLRGAGGGGGRASEAQQAQERLASIASDGGRRLQEITEQTAARLVEIDRRAAEERARLAQQLADEMATSAAAMRADAEANDLELVGVTDKAARARLEARERAEAEALARQAEINRQTRELIEQGAVEQAEALYETQSKANAERQKLDEAYYKRQAELAGNEEALAELDAQYQEAVAAADEAARIEQEIADAKAAAKIQAIQEEKAQVLAAAEEQRAGVVAKAEEQAAGVKGASESAREAVVSDLAIQAQAATDWAAATERAASRAADAYRKAADAAAGVSAPSGGGGSSGGAKTGSGSSSGGAKAAGGGTFVTGGPTRLTVGDNPGGVELVTVTPLSGRGATRTAGNMARMAGGGSLLAGDPLAGLVDTNALVRRLAEAGGEAAGYAEPLKAYAEAVGAVLDVLRAGAELGKLREAELAPIPAELAQGLADEARRVADIVRGQLVPLSEEEAEGIERAVSVTLAAIETLTAAAELGRREIPQYPLDPVAMLHLANDAKRAADIVRAGLVGYTESVAEGIERYAQAAQAAVATIAAVVDLRNAIKDTPRFPLEPLLVLGLANDAKRAADNIRAGLVGYTERVAADVERYANAAAAAVATIGAAAELRTQLQDAAQFPLPPLLVLGLANDAKRAADMIKAGMVGYTEQVAAQLERYAGAAQNAIATLQGAADLRHTLTEAAPPLDAAAIARLAQDARATVQAVQRTLIPMAEEAAAELARYADAVGAGVSALTATASFGADLFTDYRSPTDGQLDVLARDARRIADAFGRAAATMSTAGSEQAQAYADALGTTFGAAREGLLLIDALGARDWAVDPRSLRQFEESSVQILGTLERIGDRASQVPAGAIAAVTGAAGALRAQSEALAALSAVPFDNLPQLSGGLGQAPAGGGSGPTVINIYQQPGQDANALANLVISKLSAQTAARR